MPDFTSTARSLEDRLDATAEAWRPEPGDKITGEVIDLDTRFGEYGEYAIVTVRADTGDEVAIHCFHTVLAREFSKRKPRPGERLGIKYLGRSPKGYESYRVAWAEVATPNWDRIGVQAEADAVAQGIESPAPSTGDGIPFMPVI